MQTRKFPMAKSPVNDRIPQYKNIVRSRDLIPKSYSLLNKLLPVRNQLDTSMCAAFSAACIKEYEESFDMNINEYMSPEFIYKYRDTDQGMYLSRIMTVLQQYGVCRERKWLFKTPQPTNFVECCEEALNHTIKDYALCRTLDEVKKAIVLSGPVIFALGVYNNTPMWRPKTPDEQIMGGHAMVFVGYDDEKQYLIIRNSWGTAWENGGYTFMPYEDFHYVWEAYACYDADSNKNFKYIDDPDNPVNPDGSTKPGCKCIII